MNRFSKLAWLVLIVVVVACCAAPAQDQKSEQDDVVKSFKQYIKNYVDSYKTDRREGVAEFGGGWAKEYFYVDSNYGIDVRRTDSLISPYTGICQFTMMSQRTDFHATKEEAENDNSFIHVSSLKHRHTYAFQDGNWVPISREVFQGGQWWKCNTSRGLPPRDIFGCWEKHAELQSDDTQSE